MGSFLRFSIFLSIIFSPVTAQVAYTPSSVQGWPNIIETCTNFILSPGDLILDHEPDAPTLPYRLRILMDLKKYEGINVSGLEKLRISGSAQFTYQQLNVLLNKIHTLYSVPLNLFYVLDLREERHGFINGDAISIHTGPVGQEINLNAQDILHHERNFFKGLSSGKTVPVYRIKKSSNRLVGEKKPILTLIKTAFVEEAACSQYGIKYIRIPVTDHFKPREEAIETFLAFFKTLPENAWVHFHCRGGKGRTTTFMIFYDILKNKDLPLDTILKRHEIMGGTVLNRDEETATDREWGDVAAKERFLLVQRFYDYVHDSKNGYEKLSWTAWFNKYHPEDSAHDSFGLKSALILSGD